MDFFFPSRPHYSRNFNDRYSHVDPYSVGNADPYPTHLTPSVYTRNTRSHPRRFHDSPYYYESNTDSDDEDYGGGGYSHRYPLQHQHSWADLLAGPRKPSSSYDFRGMRETEKKRLANEDTVSQRRRLILERARKERELQENEDPNHNDRWEQQQAVQQARAYQGASRASRTPFHDQFSRKLSHQRQCQQSKLHNGKLASHSKSSQHSKQQARLHRQFSNPPKTAPTTRGNVTIEIVDETTPLPPSRILPDDSLYVLEAMA